MPATVSLQRCPDYSPEQLEPALDRLLAPLGGLAAHVRAGQTVLLKPNFISASAPERAATTHPALLGALCQRLQALGARPVIGDAPAWGGREAVVAATGVGELTERYGVEFVFFDRHARLPGHRAIARRFHVDPRVLAADVVINVPKLKAHQQLGFTGGMKNLYGCLAGREKALHHFTRSRTDLTFARYLTAYQAAVPCHLTIADGILAMEGRGPRLGRPRWLGVLAAGVETVAVDAVLAEIIGVPESHRLMLQAARELGLGETDPARIEVVGETVEALQVDDFRFCELVGVAFSPWRLLRGYWRFRRLLREDRRRQAG